MRWSILILTQPSRTEFLTRLLERLNPQVGKFKDVEILIHYFDKSMDHGANRQRLIDAARGEYICFVDDDDLVADDYVATIYPLLDGVDYIGFDLQLYRDGAKEPRITHHSIAKRGWSDDNLAYYRDISHLNPIKRELALQVKMVGGRGEDKTWADAMRETNSVKTEHYIPRVMYEYYFRTSKPD